MAVEFNDNGLWDERERNKTRLENALLDILDPYMEHYPGSKTWDADIFPVLLDPIDEFAQAEHERLDAYNTAETTMRGGS